MPIFEKRDHYLYMSPDEAYSLEAYKRAMIEASNICLDKGMTRILADIRRIDDYVPVMDNFELGVHIAKTLGARIKLAIVAPVKFIDKLAENAAVNRGGRVLVTEDLGEAMRWLRVD